MLEMAIGLVSLSGLTAFLALLLEWADSYFADYGECHISINGGEKVLTVQGGGKLLGTLMDNGIFVPSACGGRGSCGLCKVKVLEGGGPILPTETPYMEPQEIEDKVRLSCQIKVRNDLVIEIPEELFLIKEYQTRVAAIRELTHNIKEITLKLVDPPEIAFKPGQFIQLEVPEYEASPEPVYRAYSMCSAASRPTEVKLVITRVEKGIATTYIHDYLKEGDPVTINGPYGEFYLRDTDREILMIGAGSGLAPLMSLLHQMADEGIQRKATLFFGVRAKKDLFYVDELEAFKQKLPDFDYVLVLSSPDPEDHWDGETGLVTDAVERRFDDLSEMEAYLCGNPLMIDAAVKLLTSKGIPEERIYYDKFG
ncbi:MAG: 2Fe-2S iron-sulfur cluster binding domain-containing protein [Thermodesulfobacteriota bacterium]|nr:2Fe-2S iron-sulfur cluster binding domain-containing protein [Thermodesulfobacteriota bacterium]